MTRIAQLLHKSDPLGIAQRPSRFEVRSQSDRWTVQKWARSKSSDFQTAWSVPTSKSHRDKPCGGIADDGILERLGDRSIMAQDATDAMCETLHGLGVIDEHRL
jgi:hypothetical protein